MSNFARRRADRIRKEIPILQVLFDYGYVVDPGVDRRQQFACDLHGDGFDQIFSARVYPDTSQWYCFACQTSRDAIATVRAKEDLQFHEACRKLEHQFHLKPLRNDDPKPETVVESIEKAFSSPDNFEASSRALAVTLGTLTRERWFAMNKTLSFWEVYDQILFLVKDSRYDWDERKGLKGLAKLKSRVEQTLRVQREGA